MKAGSIGYAYLVELYGLGTRPLRVRAVIDPKVKGRVLQSGSEGATLAVEGKYRPPDTLAGHLQFALRYEGINLEALALLFGQVGREELEEWLDKSPTSIHGRRAGFLYEWLTGHTLAAAVPAKERYRPLVDNCLQIGLRIGERNRKFRILNNLPGNRDFCPMVRRTPRLDELMGGKLKEKLRETLRNYDAKLLHRAVNYLYLKETHSSFEVEREKPSPDKAQRFVDLLRGADTSAPLTEKRLVELQQAVMDPRFHEFTWRATQNWVGKGYGHRQQVDFVPPRPEDIPRLMEGILSLAGERENWYGADGNDGKENLDAVIFTAIIAFGFVFVHPFLDGNGRIHRYLIHDTLVKAGFTPKNMVLPISAIILANLDDYIAVLEDFSKPLRAQTRYDPDTPNVPAQGNDAVFFRYFDATRQAEFLYEAVGETVTEGLDRELKYLLGFDRAYQALNGAWDWPSHSLELFIRLVRQNDFRLSTAKRKRHFSWMTAAEVAQAEAQVAAAFERAE